MWLALAIPLVYWINSTQFVLLGQEISNVLDTDCQTESRGWTVSAEWASGVGDGEREPYTHSQSN